MDLFEEALRRWEEALTFRSRQGEDEVSCASVKTGAGDAIAEQSMEVNVQSGESKTYFQWGTLNTPLLRGVSRMFLFPGRHGFPLHQRKVQSNALPTDITLQNTNAHNQRCDNRPVSAALGCVTAGSLIWSEGF